MGMELLFHLFLIICYPYIPLLWCLSLFPLIILNKACDNAHPEYVSSVSMLKQRDRCFTEEEENVKKNKKMILKLLNMPMWRERELNMGLLNIRDSNFVFKPVVILI